MCTCASAAENGKDRCMNESRRKRNLMQETEDRRRSRFKRGERQVAKTGNNQRVFHR